MTMPEITDDDIRRELGAFARARIQRRRDLNVQLLEAQKSETAAFLEYDKATGGGSMRDCEQTHWKVIHAREYRMEVERVIASLEGQP